MLKNSKSFNINNEKGMAVFEMIPIIVVLVLFLNFSIGFFGAIHTGILHSIASRNYAFETFGNRADLTYFRNDPNGVGTFTSIGVRVHGTSSENSSGQNWDASARKISFFNMSRSAVEETGSKTEHRNTASLEEGRNTRLGVNPIWVKTLYGICLNAKCGDTN